MLLKNLSSHLEAVAGVKLVFQTILATSLLLNVVLAATNLTSDKTVRDIFIPPVIDKSFWVDGRRLGPEYLEIMGHWVVQQYATVTPSSVNYQNSILLKYVHPSVYGPLSVRFEAGANRIKAEALSTYFAPRDIRISEKGQATAFLGTQSTWVGANRAPDSAKAYVVVFAYDGGKTYVKEVREADPRDPFGLPGPVTSVRYGSDSQGRGSIQPASSNELEEETAPPPAAGHAPVSGLPPAPQSTDPERLEMLETGADLTSLNQP